MQKANKRLWATVHVDVAPEGTLVLSLASAGHVNLCPTADVDNWTDVAELAARWDGRRHLFTFDRGYIAANNPLCRDPLVRRLHAGGRYASQPLHVSLRAA
jgi:hypothetical protein